MAGFRALALAGAMAALAGPGAAEVTLGDAARKAPPPRPVQAAAAAADPAPAATPAATPAVTQAAAAAAPRAAPPPRDPTRGPVTNLPLPRFVSLKSDNGNARRGPGLTHRVDWIFTREGMPLKITAEYENWRRVEDIDGVGGWVHYSLLSGGRTVIVTEDMVPVRTEAAAGAPVVFQAEAGVIARVLSCAADWCRISAEGERGWVEARSLWGVIPGEVVE
jgi:SH3-like domain-containing protein